MSDNDSVCEDNICYLCLVQPGSCAPLHNADNSDETILYIENCEDETHLSEEESFSEEPTYTSVFYIPPSPSHATMTYDQAHRSGAGSSLVYPPSVGYICQSFHEFYSTYNCFLDSTFTSEIFINPTFTSEAFIQVDKTKEKISSLKKIKGSKKVF